MWIKIAIQLPHRAVTQLCAILNELLSHSICCVSCRVDKPLVVTVLVPGMFWCSICLQQPCMTKRCCSLLFAQKCRFVAAIISEFNSIAFICHQKVHAAEFDTRKMLQSFTHEKYCTFQGRCLHCLTAIKQTYLCYKHSNAKTCHVHRIQSVVFVC